MFKVGTCVNTFDDFGKCVIPCLPWNTVSDFACDEEDAKVISKKLFLEITKVSTDDISGDTVFYIMGNIYVSYNEETDIHSFFI